MRIVWIAVLADGSAKRRSLDEHSILGVTFALTRAEREREVKRERVGEGERDAVRVRERERERGRRRERKRGREVESRGRRSWHTAYCKGALVLPPFTHFRTHTHTHTHNNTNTHNTHNAHTPSHHQR